MRRSRTAALILCGFLSGGLVFAGEDKPKSQSKDPGERQQQAQHPAVDPWHRRVPPFLNAVVTRWSVSRLRPYRNRLQDREF